MLNFKPINNKRGQDDALSVFATIIALILILGFSIATSIAMAKTKYIFKGNQEVKLNLERESAVISAKIAIANQLSSQIDLKDSSISSKTEPAVETGENDG